LIHFLSLFFLRVCARQYTIGADTEAAKIEWMRATQDAINQVMLVERVWPSHHLFFLFSLCAHSSRHT
jgi:hypothetical protein